MSFPRPLRTFFSLVFLFGFVFYARYFLPSSSILAGSSNLSLDPNTSYLVVIDPGHGGSDPGKVGVSGSLEKDINLSISLLLKSLLEQQNIEVVMTRESDLELGSFSSNRKLEDMKERIRLFQQLEPDLIVSIHQNSYTSPSVEGAQCFYYTGSAESELLAKLLQETIHHTIDQIYPRQIKPNSDYYLLKHSSFPTVIVECGFLSNPREEQLLLDVQYQRRMAWAVHLGILRYLNLSS